MTTRPAYYGDDNAGNEPHVWFEGRGDPLLFLHGWGLGPAAYAPSLSDLARRGFAVAAPELTLLGRAWSASSAVARALSTLDRLGWKQADIVGNSLGGALALLLAAAEPARVRHLVLVDSVALPVDRFPLEFGWSWSLARCCSAGDLRALAALVTNASRRQGLVHLAAAAVFALRANLEPEIAAARAAGVRASVVWGERDRLLPVSMGERLAEGLDADLHVVADADHDWTVRNPAGFSEVLEAVVRGTSVVEARRPAARRTAA
jgi:pimeloyl-ACP methyl ester carboxylesterase